MDQSQRCYTVKQVAELWQCSPRKVYFLLEEQQLACIRLGHGKGNIRISVRSDNDKNIVSIRDTGLGIANHDLRHLFEHFYSSKSVEEGSGVGLSFCKRVMESMEGSISCQSVLGEYAEFTLAFPKKD